MGVWEWISSTTDLVKRNTPDVTPVTEACRKGYDVSWAATSQVNGVVLAKARDLHNYLSDDQVQNNIRSVAFNLSKNSALYLARSYGGGPIIDIVTRSVPKGKDDSQRRIEVLETKIAKLEKELQYSKDTLELAKTPNASMAHKATQEYKPDSIEDVLSSFMVNQFIGTKYLDDLIVPSVGSRRKEKLVSSSDGQRNL